MMIFYYQNLRESMLDLINSVKISLPPCDIENAVEMISHNEFGVGFEIICQQLFENNVKISPDLYQKIVEIGEKMKLPDSEWTFLEKLTEND